MVSHRLGWSMIGKSHNHHCPELPGTVTQSVHVHFASSCPEINLASGTFFCGEKIFRTLIQEEQVTGKRMGTKYYKLPLGGLPRNNMVK